jgi:hypothetical protein
MDKSWRLLWRWRAEIPNRKGRWDRSESGETTTVASITSSEDGTPSTLRRGMVIHSLVKCVGMRVDEYNADRGCLRSIHQLQNSGGTFHPKMSTGVAISNFQNVSCDMSTRKYFLWERISLNIQDSKLFHIARKTASYAPSATTASLTDPVHTRKSCGTSLFGIAFL